jgi:TonB family protein
MANGSERPPERIDSILLSPSGRTLPVSIEDEYLRNGSRVMLLGNMPPEFFDAIVGSAEIQLMRRSRIVGRIHLTETGMAIGALRRCISDALRQWGVDEAALNALQRRPASTNAMGISDADYPAGAIRRNIEGRVVLRVEVNEVGRATACAPVATSHTPEIDAAACHAVLTRGRFTPALDARGEPTASQIINTITFILPGAD